MDDVRKETPVASCLRPPTRFHGVDRTIFTGTFYRLSVGIAQLA